MCHVTHYLFGKEAAEYYNNEGIDQLVKKIGYFNMTPHTFDVETDPTGDSLLCAADGQDGWTTMTEEDYQILTEAMYSSTSGNKKYYTLFEPNENNQIGVIAMVDLDDQDLTISLIEKACQQHFDEEVEVNRESFTNACVFLSKNPTITFEVTLIDSDTETDVEFAETWIVA